MKYLPFILLSFFSLSAFSQYDPVKINKKASQLYDKGLEIAHDGNFRGGINFLQQAIAVDSLYADAWLSAAGMYGQLKNYQQAISFYEKGRTIDTAYFKDFNLPYSINLAGVGAFDKALNAVNAFLTISNLNDRSRKSGEFRKKCYLFALNYEKTKSTQVYHFEPKNLGDSVNSSVSEYYPTITIDGSKLIFTRRVNNFNEDFYGSDLDSGRWSKAKGLDGNINTNMNEGAQNISQDGQWLIFTGCNFPGGYGSCDLYISYLTSGGWSEPENLGSNVNTEFWESAPSLSPDKHDLYFSSRRPEGLGGSDIYVTHRMMNGHWSNPENLGDKINTIGDESAPFIHADNNSLYFTSSGHPGYGGDDLFVSRKDGKGGWTKPENLGYPINTIENEGSLVITADGKTAYYASDRADTRGGLDLYSFELRADVRPLRTLWVKGKVFDQKKGKGLPSSVELSDLGSGQIISNLQTDETGNYLVTLPTGKDYALNVNRKGYLFFSEHFSLKDSQPDSVYHIDIALQPVEAGAHILLNNIFFDNNKFDLRTESQVELAKVVQFMKDNAGVHIAINGYTDNVGKPEDNLTLSRNRARTVVTYLIVKGIDAKRLAYKGLGETLPIADNHTEDGKAKNRRTELTITSISPPSP